MIRPRRVRVGFDLTPMIDIVFLLIVFFMLAGEFSKAAVVRLDLPRPVDGERLVPEKHRVIVNVARIGGAIREISCEGRTWPADRFDALLGHLRAAHGDALEIELRADKRLKWQAVAPLLMQCGRRGIRRVHFVGEE